jgi:hypothetical protein
MVYVPFNLARVHSAPAGMPQFNHPCAELSRFDDPVS